MTSVADGGPSAQGARLVFAVIVWGAAVTVTLARLWHYETEPGARADAPPQWPAGSAVALDPRRCTVVMFVHPRCPCTAASLAELRRLASDHESVATTVLFHLPADADRDWHEASSWHAARSIAGVAVRADVDGAEATRFGALTSGHVVIYAPTGELRFSGGITNARGHVGENLTATAAIRRDAGCAEAPVYGCALAEPR